MQLLARELLMTWRGTPIVPQSLAPGSWSVVEVAAESARQLPPRSKAAGKRERANAGYLLRNHLV